MTHAQHASAKTTAFSFKPENKAPPSHPSPSSMVNPISRGRALVLSSSEEILDAFLFLHQKVPAALISWTMGQQAFNSCMILLLDAMELRKITLGVPKVEKAFAIFTALQNVHQLAGLAVERISWGLKELRDVTQAPAAPARPRRTYSGEAIQGAWSETTRSLHAMCEDSVMNATGMLLLEDPGLHSFVPEAFSPISWNLETLEPPTQLQLNSERGITQGETRSHSGQSYPTFGMNEFRSAEPMQGMQRSTTMRSAPTRYATPTVDDRQPPSVTIPTSHLSFAMPTQHGPSSAPITEGPRHFGHPPHLRPVPSNADSHKQWGWQSEVSSFNPAHLQRADHPTNPYQASGTQMRHNSCPLLPNITTAQSSSRSIHHFNTPNTQPQTTTSYRPPQPIGFFDQAPFQDFSVSISQSTSPAASPTHHSTRAARPTVRPVSFQMSDSALDLSSAAHLIQDSLRSSQDVAHELSLSALSHPMHYPQAMPLAMPLGAENMSLDEWKRWIGSSGAG